MEERREDRRVWSERGVVWRRSLTMGIVRKGEERMVGEVMFRLM